MPNPPSARALERAFERVIASFRKTRTPYMIIGAFALAAWGRPRSTQDLDFLILADSIPESLVRELHSIGFSTDSHWARYNPFLANLQTRFRMGSIVADILLPRDPHDYASFGRRRIKRFKRKYLWFPSPEDLLIQKLKVGRPQDFSDAVGILQRTVKLDSRYLSAWAKRLGVLHELQYLLAQMKT